MSKRTLLITLVIILIAIIPGGVTAAPRLSSAHPGLSTVADRPPSAAAETPTIRVTNLTDGAVLNDRDVEVVFETTDHTAGPIGTPHVHFHLDGDAIPFMFFNGDDPTLFGQQAVLFDFDLTSRATWVSSDTVRFNALSNGEHTLVAHLVDGQHNRLSNPEATVTRHFTVDVPSDDATPPDALIFVKEVRGEDGMDRRVFDNNPDIVSDLYMLSPVAPGGTVTQLTDVARLGGGVMSPEVSWDGRRVLFAMRRHAEDTWHIYELVLSEAEGMNIDGTGLRQITFDPPYQRANDLDPAYLPDGKIIFASDRLKQRDEYNVTISTQFYVVDADGTGLHLVEPNPSHNLNPQVIRDGRVVFDRWDHLARRNKFTVWHMNQDGSSGFTFFGGASPRGGEALGNAQGIERRELVDGEMVGIFTDRNQLPGAMAVFDNRNGNLEDLPKPIVLGPEGLYRTPHPLTTYELVYSFAPETDPSQAQFGLYTMPWEPEEVLLDDKTESTASGPGTNYSFRFYTIELDAPGRVYIEITGHADGNGGEDDDDAWLIIDGIEHKTLERRLDGELDQGLPRTYRADVDLDAGQHLIQIATDETPTIKRVRIVRAVRDGTPALLYDDPDTNEVSPIPVRARTRPPVYPSKVDRDLDWGTIVVRDISLRGDFRQPNFRDPEGDPDYNFHMDLSKLRGLRVFQSLPRRERNKDVLAGGDGFEATRVLGVAEPNEFGTTVFQVPANRATAWDLIGHDGAAIVHERVWSLVQPGEVRACGGCHVPPQFPYIQREIELNTETLQKATDLRQRGKVYTFVDDVLSILQNQCQSCHAAPSPAGGLDLRGDRASYDTLRERADGRTPRRYIDTGDARDSFLFQLLTGDARGYDDHQAHIDEINQTADHTTMLDSDELFAIATWIDTGAGFAFLPDGEQDSRPEAVGMLPNPSSTDAPQNTGVAIHFNAPIDRATLNDDTFEVRRAGGGAVTGAWRWGGNRDVLFRPDTPLAAGEYEVAINGDVLDVKEDIPGEVLEQPFSARFTVGSETDTTAPQVTQRVPDGTPVSVSGPAVLRFSEPLEPGSITGDTLWVETDTGERVEGRVALSADGLEAAFAPARPFQPGTTYTLHLRGSVRDLAGNTLGSDVRHTFSTAGSPAPQYHSLIADRGAGRGPEKIAVSADGSRVLVASQSSDAVALYDGQTWELLATYEEVGGDPHDVAFSSDGTRAVVLNTGSDDVRIIRLSDGVTIAQAENIGQPHLMDLNNAGTRLYVTDTGDPHRLHEIDAATGNVLRSLTLDHEPYDVAVDPDDHLVYVSGRDGVAVVDVDLWVERHFIEIRHRRLGEIALSPDGRRAYATDQWGDALQVVDLITGQHVVERPTGERPESVAISPDGRFVYVAERDPQTVSVVDTATLQVVRRLPSGTRATEGLAVSPDGRLVFATEEGWPGRLRVFHLGDLADGAAPQVKQVRPGNNATNVPSYAPLLIDLSEAVDRLTVNGDTVRLERDGVTIHSELQVSQDNHLVWLRPGAALQPGTTYTLRVTTGVKDLAGNALAGETATQFTTAPQPDPPPIGLWAAPEAGDNPRGVAITPDGSRVLVTDYWGDRLRIIDTRTWTETALDLGHRVGQIAVNPDGTRAYVLRPQVDDVIVVDLDTNRPMDLDSGSEELQGISVGSRPDSLLHHPGQPRLYVVNQDSGDVSVIDTQSHQEIARWPINGTGPENRDAHGIALSPDGGQLFVTSKERLSVLDAGDGHLVKTFDDLPGWEYYGVAVTPDGEQVWLASTGAGELVVIDLRVGEIIAQIQVGGYPTWLAMSGDGEWVYVLNQEAGSVSVVRRRTATVLNTVSSAGRVYALALDPDRERLYVTNDAADAVLVYQHADPADQRGPAVTGIVPSDASQGLSVVTPLKVTFNEALDRASINASTFRVIRSTTDLTGVDASQRAASANGESPQGEITISGEHVFASDNRAVTFVPDHPWQPGATYTLRLESGLTDMAGNPLTSPRTSTFRAATTLSPPPIELRSETYASRIPVALALAPDGGLLAVANHYQDTVSLLKPGTLEELAEIEVGHRPWGLAFEADGSRLYVVNKDDATLSVIDVASRQVVQTLSGLSSAPEYITLGPDELKAYTTGYYSGGIDEVDLSTGQVTRLRELERPGRPAFAPDGTLYVPERDRLWHRNANGSWQALGVGGGYIDHVIFTPDGRHAYLSTPWENRLRIVDLVLWRQVHTLAVGAAPEPITQTSDGRLLMVANEEAGTLQILDGLTYAILQTVSLPGGRPLAVVWDEARARLYVSDANAEQVRSLSLPYGGVSGTCVTDMNGDLEVNIVDVQMVAGHWRTEDSTYDLTGDGWVDVTDVMYIVQKWGEGCS